jgi:hypothetical protein
MNGRQLLTEVFYVLQARGARAHLKLLQLSLVCGNGHHQSVPLFLKLWPLQPHHLGQQLIL